MSDPATEPSDEIPEEVASDYVSDREFKDFPISQEALKAILEHGYVTATPVQAATIDAALAGRDMVVRAKTGTGKTAAFVLPTIERVPDGARKPSAVMLAPTRELAQQIAEECEALLKYRDLNVAVLVGGLAMGPQEKALEAGAEIIVGTPGRILDHCRRGNLDLSTATTAVLDEADEMLSMGFYQDVTSILDRTAKDRQVLLFSATISADTERIVRKYLSDPEQVQLSTDADNVDLIEHVLYETQPDMHKIRSLLYLLDLEDPTSAIIFCNTREDTATVATFLDRQGLDVQLLSGELSQKRRSKVMKAVKRGDVRFLVSTDVAARGIDISDLSHVINYSLPQDPSVYLHRTGRTGRIGKKGTAINLVGGADMGTRNSLVNIHKIEFVVKELPDAETAVRHRVERQAAQIKSAMSTMVFESYLPTVRALKERPDGDALLAACLRAFFQWDRARRADASDVDSLGELRESRREKDSKRSSRDDGDRKRKRGRKKKDDKRESRSTEDLDALLVADSPDAPKKKKKRRRRRKKGGEEGASASAETSSKPKSDDAPKKKKKSKKPEGGVLDDLDALLSVD